MIFRLSILVLFCLATPTLHGSAEKSPAYSLFEASPSGVVLAARGNRDYSSRRKKRRRGKKRRSKASKYSTNIEVGPLGVLGTALSSGLFSVLSAEFNFKVGRKYSLGIEGSFVGLGALTSSISAGPNFYIYFKRLFEGVFIKFNALYAFTASDSVFYSDYSVTQFEGGAYGGYKWLFKNGFTISLGLGFRYVYTSYSFNGEQFESAEEDPSAGDLRTNLLFNMGFAT